MTAHIEKARGKMRVTGALVIATVGGGIIAICGMG